MAKKAAAAPTPAAEEKQGSTRFKGVTTGQRIYEFQNQTLEANIKRKLTDQQLADLWSAEFPQAMNFSERPEMVQTVRGLYNKGKHKNDPPAEPLVAYDENKRPLAAPTRGRKKADVDEADEAPAKPAKAPKAAAAPPTKLKLRKTA